MSASIHSLIATGTKLFLDSVDPEELKKNLRWGAVGATSNPVIISDIVKKGDLDEQIESLIEQGKEDPEIAWALTDRLVSDAEQQFLPMWRQSGGNVGWVSFELDPLLEDPQLNLSDAQRTEQYIQLGKQWSKDHPNRMIKVPATPAGIDALEELAAAGVPLNVTLMFVGDQYRQARDAIWRGAGRLNSLQHFKSVYSIFISRIDVYTKKHVPELSDAAQGQVGLLNAKRIWQENQQFWKNKSTRLQQEIVFASTGAKNPGDPPTKYVEALAGSDIQTNPPDTNEAVASSDKTFRRTVDQMPAEAVQAEIDEKVDLQEMYRVLMEEGVQKFAKPQHALLELIGKKRAALTGSR